MTVSAKILSANLGFPRIGSRRELKQALESCWSGATNAGYQTNTQGQRGATSVSLLSRAKIKF